MQTTIDSKRKKQNNYRNFILGIAFLLIVLITVGIFTFRNYPSDTQDNGNLSPDDVYIKDVTQAQNQKKEQLQLPTDVSDSEITVNTPDDVFPPEQIRNVEESAEPATEAASESQKSPVVYIPQTKSLLFNSQNAMNVRAGKVYFQSENGKLESRINHDKGGVCEELYSYDEKGNQVDKLEIGYICDSAKHWKCAVIFKNKISIYETKLSTDNKNEEVVTEYLISPELKFSRGKTYTKL